MKDNDKCEGKLGDGLGCKLLYDSITHLSQTLGEEKKKMRAEIALSYKDALELVDLIAKRVNILSNRLDIMEALHKSKEKCRTCGKVL